MKKNKIDFDSSSLDRKIKSLPNVPASRATKERILKNVLGSGPRRGNRHFKNIFEICSPISMASAMIIMLLFFSTTYGIVPKSTYDGFFLMIEGNVEGANIYLGDENLGKIPLTDKINKSGELTITKEGFEDWTGTFKGGTLNRFLSTFSSNGKYQLYQGNNTIKIVVELNPINNDTIYFKTEEPGATILVNGRYAGLTPSGIKLGATHNNIEIIQNGKEKVSLDLIYDGEIRFKNEPEKVIEHKKSGYILNIESEELYIPKEGIWKNNDEYLLLENNGIDNRGKIINRNTGEVILATEEDLKLLNHVTKTDYGELIYHQANARPIRMYNHTLYYQINEDLYALNTISNERNLIATGFVGEIGLIEENSETIYLTLDGNLYTLNNGILEKKVENFHYITYFTVIDDDIIVFDLDMYISIWQINLEKESIRKIY